MKNPHLWKETKYVRNASGDLMASRDVREVEIKSRLVADLTARWYSGNLKEFAKGKLLDLGCGNAPLYGTYKPLVKDAVLADWANTEHKNHLLDVECDITKKLPFKDNEFDTIILSDVLEHIPTPQSLILELKRILKPGGVVLMNTPFMYWVHEAPYDYYRYTEFMLRRFISEVDMELIKIEPLGGGWVVLIDVLSKLFDKHLNIVKAIQKIGPKLLSGKFNQRPEIPISYAVVFRKAI